jgi:hypothetical protein
LKPDNLIWFRRMLAKPSGLSATDLAGAAEAAVKNR